MSAYSYYPVTNRINFGSLIALLSLVVGYNTMPAIKFFLPCKNIIVLKKIVCILISHCINRICKYAFQSSRCKVNVVSCLNISVNKIRFNSLQGFCFHKPVIYSPYNFSLIFNNFKSMGFFSPAIVAYAFDLCGYVSYRSNAAEPSSPFTQFHKIIPYSFCYGFSFKLRENRTYIHHSLPHRHSCVKLFIDGYKLYSFFIKQINKLYKITHISAYTVQTIAYYFIYVPLVNFSHHSLKPGSVGIFT